MNLTGGSDGEPIGSIVGTYLSWEQMPSDNDLLTSIDAKLERLIQLLERRAGDAQFEAQHPTHFPVRRGCPSCSTTGVCQCK